MSFVIGSVYNGDLILVVYRDRNGSASSLPSSEIFKRFGEREWVKPMSFDSYEEAEKICEPNEKVYIMNGVYY